MREIKFRAWWYKDIRQVTDIQFNKDGDVRRIKVVDSDKWLYPNKDIVPMQYTGLKDKNGKEIYEGDIIEAIREDYRPIGGIVDVPTNKIRVILNQPTLLGVLANADAARDGEVIGNAYENPELLK